MASSDCAFQIAGSSTFLRSHKVNSAGSNPRKNTPRQVNSGESSHGGENCQCVTYRRTRSARCPQRGPGGPLAKIQPPMPYRWSILLPCRVQPQSGRPPEWPCLPPARQKSERSECENRKNQRSLAAVAIGECAEQKAAQPGTEQHQCVQEACGGFAHAQRGHKLWQQRGVQHHRKSTEQPAQPRSQQGIALLKCQFRPTECGQTAGRGG